MFKLMLIAGAGGFVGTCGRFLVNKWSVGIYCGAFPLGTFIVNIAGSLLIGIIFGMFDRWEIFSPEARALLITGLCGGFTTFSAFSDETSLLWQRGDYATAAIYVTLSVVLGVILAFLGRLILR